MKKFTLVILSVLLIFTIAYADKGSKSLFSYIPYESATWDSNTIIEGAEGNQKFKQKVYFKNNKMRSEGLVEDPETGKTRKQVSIITGKNIYIVFPDSKTAIKYSVDSKNNPMSNSLKMYEYRDKAKKVGTGKAGGENCNIYYYKIEENETEIQEWRGKKDGFVYKTISVSDNMTATTEVKNLKINAKIPDSNFTVSKDIKVTDMSKIMNAIGGYDPENGEGSAEDMQNAMQEMMKGFTGE